MDNQLTFIVNRLIHIIQRRIASVHDIHGFISHRHGDNDRTVIQHVHKGGIVDVVGFTSPCCGEWGCGAEKAIHGPARSRQLCGTVPVFQVLFLIFPFGDVDRCDLLGVLLRCWGILEKDRQLGYKTFS